MRSQRKAKASWYPLLGDHSGCCVEWIGGGQEWKQGAELEGGQSSREKRLVLKLSGGSRERYSRYPRDGIGSSAGWAGCGMAGVTCAGRGSCLGGLLGVQQEE